MLKKPKNKLLNICIINKMQIECKCVYMLAEQRFSMNLDDQNIYYLKYMYIIIKSITPHINLLNIHMFWVKVQVESKIKIKNVFYI